MHVVRTALSRAKLSGIALLSGMAVSGAAIAIPTLQLYIEGATYNASEESWYFPGHQFRLWAIGNTNGPGGTGGSPIMNVRLAAVYDNPGSPVTITITPTVAGGDGEYGGFNDPSLPDKPKWLQTVSDGSAPLIGGSSSLPGHGEYGVGKAWQEFDLGNFTLSDSEIADFVTLFPQASLERGAQINVYDVKVEGADAHFDLYGQVTDSHGRVRNVFAPFSHDATDGPTSAPVPGTLALLGLGVTTLAFLRRRHLRPTQLRTELRGGPKTS